MKTARKITLILLLSIIFSITNAQIGGVFGIPSDFPTIAAAINTLNVMGVAAPVTINIAAGYTETAVSGGYKLFNVSGASSTNQILFRKNGSGANPLIYAYTGGTATPSSSVQDGVWWFVGTDFVTIDGIDILDPNTANPATMEFGYGFYNASTGNGCQFNTIKNCVVTLNRINGTAGAGLIAGGSRAIESVCASYTANVTTYTPSSSSGTHSYNKFYSNILQNCHHGITLMGYQSSSPYTLSDQQNDIGGVSAVTGNTIVNYGGGTGTITAGIRTKSQYSLNTSFNTIINNDGFGIDPDGQLFAIYLGPANVASVSVNSNTITLSVATPTYDIYGIYSSSSSSSLSLNILNNVFANCTFTSAGNRYMIYEYSIGSNTNISNNLFKNILGSNYPKSNRMIETNYGAMRTINSNTITNFTATGTLYSILVYSDVSLTITNNLFDSISAYLADGIFHATSPTTMVTVVNLSNNIFRNVIANEGFGIYSAAFGSTRSVIGNTIHTISSAVSATNGIDFAGINLRGGVTTVSANSIYSVTSNATNPLYNFYGLYGIYYYGSSAINISRNKIASFTSSGIGYVHGIYLELASTHTISNNVIGDLHLTNSNRSDGLVGIYLDCNGSTNNYYYYNTIYLNSASSSTANSGSSAIIFPVNGSANLRNNILVNTSVSTGTGITTVIRKPNSTLSYYSTASNNNLLYAGVPTANKYIYFDGTNTYTTLADFKAFATPREAQSVTENPPFITINGSLANFLNLITSIPTLAESGATAITGFTTDYSGSARNATTPDIGAWEGNYTLPDLIAPALSNVDFISPACNLTGRTLTVNISDVSGVASGTSTPRLYYRLNFGLYTSVQGSLTSGTYSNGVWTFNMNYSATASDIVRYFFTVQDQSQFNNIGMIPATGGSLTSVTNIVTYPTTTYTYIVDTPASITVNSGTICSGQNFTLTASGASTYSFTGGSAIVSPTVTTSYSVIGTGSSGCLSSNTAVASVTVFVTPTITVNSGTICSGEIFTITPFGATSYTYSGGSAQVNPITNTSYSIIGTNTTGCISSSVISQVSVNTTPTISVNSGSLCFGTNFNIIPSGAGTYTISGNALTVSPPSTTLYLVTGTGTNGCMASNTATSNLIVHALPTISVSNGTLCTGSSFTLNPSGASIYIFPGGNSVVNPITNTFYPISGTSSVGCASSNTAIAILSVFSLPTIWVNSATLCAGSLFSMTPTGASSYTFSNGSATVIPSASASYTVTGANLNGCISSTIANVTVYSLPTISVNSGSICSGEIYTISPTGANSYTFLNGTNTVSPLTTTSYSIIGSSIEGCLSSNTAISSITVNSVPSVSLNSGSICLGNTFTFAPIGANTYTFINGTTTVSPTSNTSYSLVGTSAQGCVSNNTAVATVSVNLLPNLTVNSGTICAGDNFTLIASGANTYSWSNSNTNPSTIVNPLITTVYSVSGTNTSGCVSVATTTINALPKPIVTISPNSASVCLQSSVSFSTIGASTYSWSNGYTGSSVSFTPTSSQVYTVIGIDVNLCASSQTVSVTSLSLPIISISGNSTVCNGQATTLSATGASTYSWNTGNVLPTLTINPIVNTNYLVTGTNALGCISSVSIAVNTLSLPIVSIAQSTNIICATNTISLTASGGISYTWNTGASTSTITHTVTVGLSQLTVTATNNLGCSSNAIASFTGLALPVVVVNPSLVTICEQDSILLTVNGATSYTWLHTNSHDTSQYVSPHITTEYTVSGMEENGCENTAVATIKVTDCTGLVENKSQISIEIFPNPFTRTFKILQSNNLYDCKIEISDNVGRVLVTLQHLEKEEEFDMRDYANGLYQYRISKGDQLLKSGKLIKQ